VLSQQESSRKDPDSGREVFRSAGSVVLSWAWLLVAVITLIDLAVQGRDHAAAVTAILIVTISAVVYGCAWRPRIVADSGGITVANPLRDHQVPWAAVANVDVVNSVRVHCAPAPGSAAGKILYSWAVQASPSSARRASRRAGLSGQRPRLTRPRGVPAGPPAGTVPRYGQLPEQAKDALDRTSAEFTAGRLAERAQHARQASAVRAQQAADPQPVTDPQEAGPREAVDPQKVAVGQAGAGEGPVVRWAWAPIAAMAVPLALLIIVLLI
jgi:hypothetical protein